MGAGVGRYAAEVTTEAELLEGVRIAPGGTVPPTGGAWWLYHSFSVQLTMLAAP
jgi:hypothetical protein